MNIEDEIFKRSKVNFKKLLLYGFVKKNNTYKYSKEFMNTFRADIMINENGVVLSKVFDINTNDEYINFRIEEQNGEFVSKVREEYKKILKDIDDNCFEKKYFIYEQSNVIANLIKNYYNDEPYFAWEKSPGAGVFRNPNNKKWYGLLMNIDKSKLDKKYFGEVEIINVKLSEEKILELLKREGFYKAYHMNKKNWITIILDDTLSNEDIFEYIKISHSYTELQNKRRGL